MPSKSSNLNCAGLLLLCVFAARGGSAIAAPSPLSFRAQIAPILLQQCQTCHGAAEQKGGYRLDTFDFLSRNEEAGFTRAS